jgi:hypothetical protein
LIFVDFINFKYLRTFINIPSDFVYKQGAFKRSLDISEMLTFFTNVLVMNTRTTQTEWIFLFHLYGRTGWYRPLGATTVHLIRPFIRRQASTFLHVSPTWMTGWPIENLKYLQMYGYRLIT